MNTNCSFCNYYHSSYFYSCILIFFTISDVPITTTTTGHSSFLLGSISLMALSVIMSAAVIARSRKKCHDGYVPVPFDAQEAQNESY